MYALILLQTSLTQHGLCTGPFTGHGRTFHWNSLIHRRWMNSMLVKLSRVIFANGISRKSLQDSTPLPDGISKQQKLYYQIVARKCFQIALHTRLMMKILQTFERYHQINNRNEEKLTRKQIQAHTRENTQEFILFGFQRISMGIRQKIFSLMNVENTKWCNSTLTSHNAQIPIHPNYSLIQVQSSLSIQKLGLSTKFGVASS